jgi:hypothetical protein
MVPFNRFTVVLDACTLFPIVVRDVLLTLADHELFNPRWLPRIRDEWIQPLSDVRPWQYSGNSNHPTEKAVSVLRALIESFSKRPSISLSCARRTTEP